MVYANDPVKENLESLVKELSLFVPTKLELARIRAFVISDLTKETWLALREELLAHLKTILRDASPDDVKEVDYEHSSSDEGS